MSEHDKDKLHSTEHPEEHARPGHTLSGEPVMDSDINYASVIQVGVVGSLITFALIIALEGFYWQTLRDETEAELIGSGQEQHQYRQFTDLRAKQETDLLAPSKWTDAQGGLVSLPISDAIKSTLTEEQLRQSRAEAAAATAPPAAAATITPAATDAQTSAAEAATEMETSNGGHGEGH